MATLHFLLSYVHLPEAPPAGLRGSAGLAVEASRTNQNLHALLRAAPLPSQRPLSPAAAPSAGTCVIARVLGSLCLSKKSLSSIQVRHTTSKVSPDLGERSMFGVPLETLIQDATQYGVPFLVTQMVEYLEAFGLERVGIFRISGSVNKIKELKQKYNQGENVDLVTDGDVDSVASLLKLFLKELPVAVFPDNICSGLLNTFQEHKIHTTECIENLRQLLNCLPKAHQSLLQFLSAFLLKVATHSAVNFMTLENLAIVFGPTLFKIPVSPLASEEQRLYNGLLLYLLQHHEMLFVDWNSCFSQRQADGLQENNTEDEEKDSLMLLRKQVNYSA
ncbi:protein FAM13A-like [Pezoporus occidentalis]|uniref:protein FAM13A-like n=1 Tax=Pezoporus occidentalis TaxID=407982 RepID=UPI002F9156D5